MKHRTFVLFLLLFAFFATLGFAVARYLGFFQKSTVESTAPVFVAKDSERAEIPVSAATLPAVAGSYTIQEVARGLEVPWSMVFTSPTRILVSERSGTIRVVENGALATEPVLTVPEVSTVFEEGMMGLALDPDYATNRWVYVCYAYGEAGAQADRIVRYLDEGSRLTSPQIILDDIPAAKFHAGCELGFGPDGKLYVSTGDATSKEIAQDLQSLGGKILRLNADGSVPADNPFPNSLVWSYGHRNPQGFDWLGSGTEAVLFEAEHGPSGNDGPGGGDEINIITPGQNYGWPVVSHERSQAGMVDPKLVFTPAVAPASLLVYKGDQLPQFTGNIFFAMLRGTGIIRVVVSPNNPEQVLFYERLPGIEYGRIRDVAEGPDGAIYFTTSNRDGRGSVKDGDDKIYKIVKKN